MDHLLQVSPALVFDPAQNARRGRFVLKPAGNGPLAIAAVQIDSASQPWRVILRDRAGAPLGTLELWLDQAPDGELRAASASLDALTRRQREILELVARGCAVKTIASRLQISVKTVEFHKTRLMRRLNLHGTAELTRFAVATGLISV